MTQAALESEVRSYCRGWPTTFTHGRGSRLYDGDGRAYLDFFAGAGALNYGHNHPVLKQALLSYLDGDGVTHSLDMATAAKADFLEAFGTHVLAPRNLDYRVQFCGPTGTNSVEAALKLARKVTGRPTVVAFTGAFHGMSLGSLAVTGNAAKRAGAGVPLGHTFRVPYDGFGGPGAFGLDLLESTLDDSSSGVELPAAVIVETVQGEGGVNVARAEWLVRLAQMCRERGVLLIVDDVQMGCGRTGPFFSFEQTGVEPDIVCLSKSISGYGLPMALTLFRPELDVWNPGEHNGTFRGFNPAFVTAAATLREFWSDGALEKGTADKAAFVEGRLDQLADRFSGLGARTRGRGLVRGLEFDDTSLAGRVGAEAFTRGLLVETSGSADQVVKLLPPLTTTEGELAEGLDVLAEAVAAAART
ncbi:diaminobutyrate--2-oxoglutarate transaminase [Streptomyces sudanensis]|uniref:diaminobutyrate--2-oxoglutarate transaminase n=1 Tax=Streptomyces sudanensis TaxID=436397 RepID=UPI0020CD2028|nr:diaminobutyrate--2-oxoglutarate transaminase [Streptomyces sudanensis]MCP9959913.1 diaminobutyrate--2-oxoglutarate transaminase [Streptomyces sudanensis]MCP9999683.1 diaminobutyrate--2-oxoglutarate transaminase [Streptomyces sudanensis]